MFSWWNNNNLEKQKPCLLACAWLLISSWRVNTLVKLIILLLGVQAAVMSFLVSSSSISTSTSFRGLFLQYRNTINDVQFSCHFGKTHIQQMGCSIHMLYVTTQNAKKISQSFPERKKDCFLLLLGSNLLGKDSS